jgi:hypothetical protein
VRIVFALLLLVAIAPAWAQWVKEDDPEHAVQYIDSASISKVGQMRRVWVTQYLRAEGPDGEMSRRAFLEYDCAGRRFRYLSTAKHSAPKLVVPTPSSQGSTPQDSAYVPPTLDYKSVHRIICATR